MIREKRIIRVHLGVPMGIRKGLLARTSGIPIPLTITLDRERFHLREYVIKTALTSEDRPLTDQEEDHIIHITRALKREYPECWSRRPRSDYCLGIIRAARTLLNLIDRHEQRSDRQDIEDLKRWVEYGKKL